MNKLTIGELKEIYLNDLRKLVPRGHDKLRARARHPEQYARLNAKKEDRLFENENHLAETWVWSDQHFGHDNILGFSFRPFITIHEMAEAMIANFNDYVGEHDTSIWVGDVAFLNDREANFILDRCNGHKILVAGNHDFNKKKLKKLNFDEVYIVYLIEHLNVDLVFTHYPIEQGLPWPYINVHGHLHDGASHPRSSQIIMRSQQHINVNCEFHDYRPIPLSRIVGWANTRINSHDK